MKLQEDSCEEHSSRSVSKVINNPLHNSDSKNNRKYNKITHDLRLQFLDKIFFENKSIKKAAQELNINYSSAKTILNLHRKKQRFIQQPICSITEVSSDVDSSKICGFQAQTIFKKQKLELITTLGGRLMNSNKIEPSTVSPPCPPLSTPSISNSSEQSLLQQHLQHQQQQQFLIKILQEKQQEQQRIQLHQSQQSQLLQQQQHLLNLQSQQQQQFNNFSPQILALLVEKQKQQQQEQLLLTQMLYNQQGIQQKSLLNQQPIYGVL